MLHICRLASDCKKTAQALPFLPIETKGEMGQVILIFFVFLFSWKIDLK